MFDRSKAKKALSRLFGHQPVADLPAIERAIGTRSRATVFRILSEIGYRTSCSHAGRYYTLKAVPRFDEKGLWMHGEILFSRFRTLRSTIVHFLDAAKAGHTHAELEATFHLRLHDTLHALVKEKQIGRVAIEGLYVYVSADRSRSKRQVTARRRSLEGSGEPATLPNRAAIIDVLLAFIHHPREDPVAIASILEREGKPIPISEIRAVFQAYALGKKKPRHRARGRERGAISTPGRDP